MLTPYSPAVIIELKGFLVYGCLDLILLFNLFHAAAPHLSMKQQYSRNQSSMWTYLLGFTAIRLPEILGFVN